MEMSETDWAGDNEQMGEVALPAKFSAKKYTRRWMVPSYYTAATYCSLSPGSCIYSTVHISTTHTTHVFLCLSTYVLKRFSLVCSCVWVNSKSCATALIIWLIRALCRLLRQKHVPVNWREASILIKCIHHTQDSHISLIGQITWPKIG